tara:strand:- start:419 stop:2275 length:1857 start_codon:yes stop_codon:yes gene_type:complete
MATKPRTNRSPYMSANLGSGARTTTGGTYENPRLGIEDYTAFSRGVASTFRIPEEEEKEQEELQGFNTAFELGKNDFLKNNDPNSPDFGKTYSIEVNPTINQTWANTELAALQKQYEKADTRGKAAIQNHINGYKQAIGAEGSSFQKYLQYVSDPDVYDVNVSNKFLPGADGKNSSLTIDQFAKINSENPSAVKISSRPGQGRLQGTTQYGFEVNGQFINASAMTDQWLSDNFNVKSNLGLDTQKAIGKDGATPGYTTVKATYNTDGASVSLELPGGAQVQTTKNAAKYIRSDWYSKTDEFANKFATSRYSGENDAIYESAWSQLSSKYKDGSFTPTREMLDQLGVENASDIVDLKLNDQQKLILLQDQAKEEFKVVNGNTGYIRGEDGRALSRNVVQYQKDTVIKDGPDKGNSIAGNSLYTSFKSLVDTQAFEGASGDIFAKQTVDPGRFVDLMTKSSKSGDFYFTKEELLSNKNQLRDRWVESTNKGIKKKSEMVTADDFDAAVSGTVGGKDNVVFKVPAKGGKFEPVAGFDGTILGAMGIYGRDSFGSNVDQARAINYAQSLFLSGGDVSTVQDPFQSTGLMNYAKTPGIGVEYGVQSAGDQVQVVDKSYVKKPS